MDDESPYLLLTPGPLTTSRTVRQAMQRDSCTWDADYHRLVTEVRRRLVRLAGGSGACTAVLMQGSGTFCVEAAIGSGVPPDGRVLVVDNGVYGRRMALIAERLRIPLAVITHPETELADTAMLDARLDADPGITHVCLVHCETTTGLLNPAEEVGRIVRAHGRTYILDAMSSFGGIPMDFDQIGAHDVISSANKCLQGVPGFGFVLADAAHLERTQGWARSLSLDLFDQWWEMESRGGKWRFTSPTHVVRAFLQALQELDDEGGVPARHRRYLENHRTPAAGMATLGFRALLPEAMQSPVITSFVTPSFPDFSFERFYEALKQRGFVIYPGKVSRGGWYWWVRPIPTARSASIPSRSCVGCSPSRGCTTTSPTTW